MSSCGWQLRTFAGYTLKAAPTQARARCFARKRRRKTMGSCISGIGGRWRSTSPQPIHRAVDLGALALSVTSDGLALRSPSLRPALRRCARTMVESIITYSLSGSCDKAFKMRSPTPDRLYRKWRIRTTRGSLRRSRRSRHGMPARYRYNTTPINSRLARRDTDASLASRQRVFDVLPR